MSSIDKAFKFYSRHLYDEEKIELLNKHKLKIAGSVPSVLWELFGALLTERSEQVLTFKGGRLNLPKQVVLMNISII